MASPGRAERPGMPQRRRNFRVIHRNIALPYYRNIARPSSTTSSASSSWLSGNQNHSQQSPQPNNLEYLDYLDLSSSPSGSSPSGSSPSGSSIIDSNIHHDDRAESPRLSFSPLSHTSSISNPPPPNFTTPNNDFYAHSTYSSQISSTGLPWDILTPNNTNLNSDLDGTSISSDRSGTYGSMESIALSTPNTAASSFSDGYELADVSPPYGSPASRSLLMGDLNLLGDYFRPKNIFDASSINSEHISSPSSSNSFIIESDSISSTSSWNIIENHTIEDSGWPTTSIPQYEPLQDPYLTEPSMHDHVPWNSQDPRISGSRENATAGGVAFEPHRGSPFRIFTMREGLISPQLPTSQYISLEPTNQIELETSAPVQQSHQFSNPHSPASSLSQPGISHYSHIFPLIPNLPLPNPRRGRSGPRSSKEREETLQVRNAGACWACHLSKTKCSPCSPGSPCEQCTKLLGKRRFCLLPCFNDTIESLNTFLIPEYLTSHFTQANLTTFITQHATTWSSHEIPIQLLWGPHLSISVTVVTLSLRDEESEIGYQHQCLPDKSGGLEIIRKESPPLGIPLAGMGEMQVEYRSYVRDIIRNKLDHYVSIAYAGQGSKLPQRLLRAICNFYAAGLKANDENILLRNAIEIHTLSSLLSRSLILCPSSLSIIQTHLQQQYPARSAPRCAQRQIKLAVFNIQRLLITKTLKAWGKLLHTLPSSSSHASDDWTTAFGVFMVLVLVMDKTLKAAYTKCESKIKFKKEIDVKEEKREFGELVRLMEKDFFGRCKEIFHTRYKTRKAGKGCVNPLRDGVSAWHGQPVDGKMESLVGELRGVVTEFGTEIKEARMERPHNFAYRDLGRLGKVFLGEFLNLS